MQSRFGHQIHARRGGVGAGCGREGERGFISPLVLGLMVVLLTVSMSFLALTQKQSSFVVDDGKRMAALEIAEAGIDHIVWRLRQAQDAQFHYGPRWRTLSDERDIALPGGQYYLSRIDTNAGGGVRGYLMEGWVPSRTAADAVCAQIYVELSPIYLKPWAGAVLGDRGVPVANGDTDSYDGSAGPYGGGNVLHNGDIATNNPAAGSINISNGGTVGGNVYYPTNGSAATVSNSGTVTGSISTNPANTTFVDIPTTAESAYQWGYSTVNYVKPVTSNPPVFVLTNSTGSITGATLASPIPPGVYVVKKDNQGDSIKLSGSGGLTFNASSYTLIYLEGNADISGNGISNVSTHPSNLQFYGMTTCTSVKIAGNANFFGVVYAPSADITLNGGGMLGGMYGSIAGRTVSFNGNGTFLHYDESLRQMAGVIRNYKIYSWTQTK